MKLGIIIDSSAGLTKEEAEQKNWNFLPLYMNIDGKEYADGVDLSASDYYNIVNIESNIRTSASTPGISQKIIEKASKENDYVIVYPLSKMLSSQANNLTLLARNFPNVFVVPSLGVGYSITRDLEDIQEFAKTHSWEEVKKEIVNMTEMQFGIAVPQTLKWLVKGGRASEGTAKMANLLKVVPLISFQKGKLEKYGKGRVFEKVAIKIAKDLKDKFGNSREYIIYHSNNSNIEEYKAEMEKILGHNIRAEFFPSVITNHIGPGAIAIMTRKKSK